MAQGFNAPGVLFLGAVHQGERSFCNPVYRGLLDRGYTRYVELCSGAFAMSLVAAAAGWKPKQIETSDVSLLSSILGYFLAGKDLGSLGMTLDGEPVEIVNGSESKRAAHLLWTQLVARTEAQAHIPYWRGIADDLIANRDHHTAKFAAKLDTMYATLGGMQYEALDMWEHIDRVADDPHTVLNANPPSYAAGFEKFFNTNDRVAWDEPSYDMFDPETGYPRLRERMADAKALIIHLEEGKEPDRRDAKEALYARPMGKNTFAYLRSNRPEEIFAINGGFKVYPRKYLDLEPADMPVIPYDYEITDESVVRLVSVKSTTADYYRDVWMHRLAAEPGPLNLLVTIDGYAAGVIGYNHGSIMQPRGKYQWAEHVILRFAFGAPHQTLRLTRLATMLALLQSSLNMLVTPSNAIYLAVARGLVTIEYTRHPEAKGLRGLMRLDTREKHPDGFRLVYAAEWRDSTPADTVKEFLVKEKKWLSQQKR